MRALNLTFVGIGSAPKALSRRGKYAARSYFVIYQRVMFLSFRGLSFMETFNITALHAVK